MRTLIYKRTHCDDPDPQTGVFGNEDCMKKVRRWPFNAVIGIGGVGLQARSHGIARKITWIGIGRKTVDDPDNRPRLGPCLAFDHFWYRGEDGPLLKKYAPTLARRMLDDKNVRTLIDSLSREERQEVETILHLAEDAPPSPQLAKTDFQATSGKCPSNSCHG